MSKGNIWVADEPIDFNNYKSHPELTSDRWEDIQRLRICCKTCIPDIDSVHWKSLVNEESGHAVHIAYWQCATTGKFAVWEWNA